MRPSTRHSGSSPSAQRLWPAPSAGAWARRVVFVVGWLALLRTVVSAMGGLERLFQYSNHPAHKFTAHAMMHGALNLRHGLMGVGHDEQIYNGAGYTNWGFGVPLLQIPFHALALLPALRKRLDGSSYFPDRAIFFFYAAVAVVPLWTGVQRMMFPAVPSRTARSAIGLRVVSWSVTLLILAFALYDLTSYRFIVYEETIAYFVLLELVAIGCYAHWVDGGRLGWAAAAALAAGIATLVRPTGLPYLAMWLPLLWLERRDARTAVVVSAAAAPPLAFWLYSNWVRSGDILSIGFENALPAYFFHYSTLRFGSTCNDTVAHTFDAGVAILRMLFVQRPEPTPAQVTCGFLFEKRIYETAPYLPPAALLIVVGDFVAWVRSPSRRVSEVLPHVFLVLVFGLYLRAGAGLSYRYAGDFWPLIVLIGLQGARRLRIRRGAVAAAFALACGFFAYVRFEQDVWPALRTIDAIPAARMVALETEYERTQAQVQPPVDASISCNTALPAWLRADAIGWFPDCSVGPAMNLYIGLPKAAPNARYRLRLDADFVRPELRVVFNGKKYVARWKDGAYIAEVTPHPARFHTPVAMFTVQWSPVVSSERLFPIVHLKKVTLETT